jgi:hypothetical protein
MEIFVLSGVTKIPVSAILHIASEVRGKLEHPHGWISLVNLQASLITKMLEDYLVNWLDFLGESSGESDHKNAGRLPGKLLHN